MSEARAGGLSLLAGAFFGVVAGRIGVPLGWCCIYGVLVTFVVATAISRPR